VLLENVPFMMQLEKGRALKYVVSQLEKLGYRWAYRVVDSRAFGVPQRRRRVFILASLQDDPRRILLADDAGRPVESKYPWGTVAYGFYWTEGWRGLGWAVDSVPPLKGGSGIGIPGPPAVLLPDGRIVTPSIRDAERLQGFEEDWTKPAEALGKKGQRWRWRLVGNAVTVDVAEWIGTRLAAPGAFDETKASALSGSEPWPTAAWNMGKGRFRADVSDWPVQEVMPPLAAFLHEPELLSARAAAGFLSRVVSPKATIRCPREFVAGVESYLSRVAPSDEARSQVKVA
jgi:DNA (cytosine-5)-methyltransferase 1